MKAAISRWWALKVIYPYVMKHQPETCVWLKNAIVYQMWYAKINFIQINKWLEVNNLDTIKEYTLEGRDGTRLRMFFEVLPPEKRNKIKTKIYKVNP